LKGLTNPRPSIIRLKEEAMPKPAHINVQKYSTGKGQYQRQDLKKNGKPKRMGKNKEAGRKGERRSLGGIFKEVK